MRSLLVSLVVVGLLSCREHVEIIKEVEPTHTWSLDSTLFGPNKFLLSSYKLNESTLLVGNSTSIWTVETGDLKSKIINGSYLLKVPATWDAPALHQAISVSVEDDDHLRIYPTRCPACVTDVVEVSADYSTSTESLKGFMRTGTMYGNHAGGYPATSDGYILAPHEMDFATQTATCLLIKIDTSESRTLGPHLELKSVTPIQIVSKFYLGGPAYFSACYYDKFFVSMYGNFFRMDKSGSVRSFGLDAEPPHQMFILNKILFAVCGPKVYQSIDKGETWTLFTEDFGVYSNLYYFNVGDELYATRMAQISRVTMTGNTMNFVELDNDGLETDLITSLNKAGKYAFVTTTSGLYYRDTVDFHKPKDKK